MASLLKWLRRGLIALAGLLVLLLGAGWAYEHLSERSDAARYKPPGQLVDVGGGRRLHINCTGQGAPTVVIEPGAGEFAALVTPLQRRVAAFTRVCSYDRAGFGWSDPPPPGRSFDQRAADLAALLKNANVEGPYVLVGASYGGLLVRSFAHQQPDKVAGVVLVDAAEEELIFSHLPLMRQATNTLRVARIAAEFGVTRLAVTQMVKQAKAEGRIPADANDADIEPAIGFSAEPSSFRNSLDENTAYEGTLPEQRRAGGFGALSDRPLIVLRHGKPFSGINGPLAALEPGWTASQRRLASLSSNSRLIVATNNGHDIIMENPALVGDSARAIVDAVRAHKPLTN